MSGAAIHAIFLEVQSELKSKFGWPVIELKNFSDTRWTCQYASCAAVKRTFAAVRITLLRIIRTNKDRSAEARGISRYLDFEFLVQLCIFTSVLGDLKTASDYLQSESCSVAIALNLIEGTCINLQDMLDDPKHFESRWDEAVEIALHNEVPVVFQQRRHIQLPARFLDFVVPHGEGVAAAEDLEDHDPPQSKEEYREKLFIPVLNKALSELRRRFSDNSPVLRGMFCLQPEDSDFLNIQKLKPFAEHYSVDMESVEIEAKLAKKSIQRYQEDEGVQISDMLGFAHFLQEYQVAFHELFKLVRIALCCPASSAGCERSFSCLRRIKTYLRNRMSSDRLSSLAILNIERSLTKSIDIDTVVTGFDSLHENRRIILH